MELNRKNTHYGYSEKVRKSVWKSVLLHQLKEPYWVILSLKQYAHATTLFPPIQAEVIRLNLHELFLYLHEIDHIKPKCRI